MPYKLLTACFKLVTTNWEQAVRTQLVDSLFADLYQLVCRLVTTCEQICNNLFADLLQLVRFYVCRT